MMLHSREIDRHRHRKEKPSKLSRCRERTIITQNFQGFSMFVYKAYSCEGATVTEKFLPTIKSYIGTVVDNV